jgi:predicted O-linked N-acetylglucosamine transferase (SPINDLY family)
VSYLGYPGTLGAPYVDYLIADGHVLPAAHRDFYTEKVVYLPDCYQVNDSRCETSAAAPQRADAGLPPHGVVFCCFHQHYKITPAMFEIWLRLLATVEGSVLWLLEGGSAVSRNLRTAAAQRGIEPGRLVFAPLLPHAQHLARLQLADLFLDTLPVNAHTTASDALRMGLPVLSCPGEAFVGRVAGSLLHAVGLPELVVSTLADYERRARELATTPSLLLEIRARLARNLSAHPLFDTDRFRRHLESAYLTMMERHRRGLAPAGFSVQPLAPAGAARADASGLVAREAR